MLVGSCGKLRSHLEAETVFFLTECTASILGIVIHNAVPLIALYEDPTLFYPALCLPWLPSKQSISTPKSETLYPLL